MKAMGRVIVFDTVFFMVAPRFLHFQATTSTIGHHAITVAMVLLWMEVWFYSNHRLLHTRWLYPIHAQHHKARVPNPITSLSYSIAERATLSVGGYVIPVLASHILPMTMEATIGVFVVTYVVNVVGHTNVEFFSENFPKTRLGRVFISVTFHSMHHARITGHYGLYTRFLDRAFGTEFSDYAEVHHRAASGEGLQTLGARLEPRGAFQDQTGRQPGELHDVNGEGHRHRPTGIETDKRRTESKTRIDGAELAWNNVA